MRDRHIELTWVCSACGTKNLGRHMACTSCGDPKDDREVYEMPDRPEEVASVEDPALLRLAEAGANWSCAYCGSDQRDLEGGCLRCGAGRASGANARAAPGPPAPHATPAARRSLLPRFGVAISLFLLVSIGFVAYRSWPRPPEPPSRAVVPSFEPPPAYEDRDVTVAAVAWTRTVRVERWALAPHEGFVTEAPAGAVEVRTTGTREHHVEEVPDGFTLVSEDVEVPDGTRTETTTERVRCGEDCTTTARRCRQVCTRTSRSCRQVCTNKKNGFASCKEECSGGEEKCREDCTGGDRRCETKYCSETRTRQVPKTRRETRTRQVPKTRSVPRFAAWGTYKTWEWVLDHTEETRGDDALPRWPDAGARPYPSGKVPAPGDRRAEKTERFTVTLRADGDPSRAWTHRPASEEELARFAPGARVRIRVGPGNAVTIL